MSLAIDVNNVISVLLADGWHEVADASFGFDAYEYVWRDELMAGGNDHVCSTGFHFDTFDGDQIVGPMTSILAVRTSE